MVALCPLNISLSIDEGHDVYKYIEHNELTAAFDSALEAASFPLVLSNSDKETAVFKLSLIKAYVARRPYSIAANVVVEVTSDIPTTSRYYRGTELADTYWWGNSPEEVFQSAFEEVVESLNSDFYKGCNARSLAI